MAKQRTKKPKLTADLRAKGYVSRAELAASFRELADQECAHDDGALVKVAVNFWFQYPDDAPAAQEQPAT